jgi:phosphoadenosine phosphosulfate reductase
MHLKQLEVEGSKRITSASTPQDLLEWALARFAGQRMTMTTGFGMEGCALIDMIASRAPMFQVVYLDTHFLFEETLQLRDRLAERYPNIEFVNRGTDYTPQQQAIDLGEALWKRDPNECCRLRKVVPMAEVMKNVDVWITGLRRTQSSTRQEIRIAEWDFQYDVLKVSPLAKWGREDVWKYIQENNVPYNPLHEKGYPSIGCTHCTKAVDGASVTDYSREGRWEGTGKTECGLHGAGI